MKISLLLIIFFIFSTGLAVACYKPQPSIIPSIEPTIEVTIEPSEAPLGEEPTITIEPTLTAGQSAQIHGDGKSDGLSSCPSCTQAPILPSAPPATGRGI